MYLVSLLLVFWLGPTPGHRSPSTPPLRLIHGGPRAPESWFAATPSGLWVCWRAPSNANTSPCWSRVTAARDTLSSSAGEDRDDDLGAARARALPRPSSVRASFLDPALLVLADGAGHRWVLRRQEDRAHLLSIERGDPLDARVAVLARPEALACSPTGWLPSHHGGAWRWRQRPCESRESRVCVAPTPPALRRPTGLSLSLGVELRAGQRALLDPELTATPVAAPTSQTSRDITVLALARLNFDPLARVRGAQLLRAFTRDQQARRARVVPAPSSQDRELRRREASALRRAVCPSGEAAR